MPDVGSRSPTTSWRRVVLPAPFGPTRPTTLPAGMERVQFVKCPLTPEAFREPGGFDGGIHAGSR